MITPSSQNIIAYSFEITIEIEMKHTTVASCGKVHQHFSSWRY